MNKQTTEIVIETLVKRIANLEHVKYELHDAHLNLSYEFDTLAREYGKYEDRTQNCPLRLALSDIIGIDPDLWTDDELIRAAKHRVEELKLLANKDAVASENVDHAAERLQEQEALKAERNLSYQLREALAEIAGVFIYGVGTETELIRSAKERVEQLKLLALEQPKEEAEGQPEDDAAAEPVTTQDKTKQPRIWKGATVNVGEHWCWYREEGGFPKGWMHYDGMSVLHSGDRFIGGSIPKPTVDPAGMQLEECSVVDWVVKEQDND